MPYELVSKIVILISGAVLAVIGVTDIWLSVAYSPDVSISATVHRLSKEYPALPFVVGLVMGHLFWR
jgi:hypothetical protein